MSSINFNGAATSALRTLQQSNAQLDATQGRISTGLKIGEAKDNAAYWSISTTMKSDNKALSTVTDALGLGAATLDTAYQGLSAAKDVLDEIKSKLTAALGSNVDRTAIQAEIESLQNQLKSIATSSTFSGENWLSVNSGLSTYSAEKTVVSSFTRDVSGSVTVGEIKFDSKTAVLFDGNTNAGVKGILDTATDLKVMVNGAETNLAFGGAEVGGNKSTGGVSIKSGVAGTGASPAYAEHTMASGALTMSGFGLGDTVTFKVFYGSDAVGKDISVVVDGTNSASQDAFRTALQNKIDTEIGSGKLSVVPAATANGIKIQSAVQGADQTFKVGEVSVTNDAESSTLGLTTTPISLITNAADGTRTKIDFGDFNASGAKLGDTLTFSLAKDGTAAKNFSIVLDATNTATGTALKTAIVTALNDTTTGFGANTFRAVTTATATEMEFELVTPFATASAGVNNRLELTTAFDITQDATVLATVGITTTAGTQQTGAGTRSQVVFDKFEAMTFDADDQLGLTVNGSNVSITKAVVDAALGGTAGKISTVADYAKVLNTAFATASATVSASVNADGDLAIDNKAAGAAAAAISITAVTANEGTVATGSASAISVAKIDISDSKLNSLGATDADKRVQAITAYINVVNGAINKVTSAASSIGAVSKRVDMQETFVQNLMDTIEKGVSGLVDADMNEESTKLQALQVKQSLGVQALSIANQSAQNVLRLFQ